MSSNSTNPKDAIGRTKPPMHLIPPVAMVQEAQVMRLGADKYGPYNWREHSVAASVYVSAAQRHLLQWFDGESIDPESGASHLAHARACLGILLDAESLGQLVDDRPPAGMAANAIYNATLPPHVHTFAGDPRVEAALREQFPRVETGTIPVTEADIRAIGEVFGQYKGRDLIHVGDLPTVVFLARPVDEPANVEYTSSVPLPDVTERQYAETLRGMRERFASVFTASLGCHPHVAEHIAGGTSFPVEFVNAVAISGTVADTDIPPTVYIAGPMRGYDEYNYPAFHRARNFMLSRGYAVISPADIDLAADGGEDHEYDASQRSYVYRDLMTLMGLGSEDAIAMLPGWEKSTGAVAEFMVARWLGLNVLDATTGGPLTVQGSSLDNLWVSVRDFLFKNENRDAVPTTA